MTALMRSVSPAAQVAVAEMRQRAIARYLGRNRAGGTEPASTLETTFVGLLVCTVTPGPTTTGGTRSYRAEFSLDDRPISTERAGLAMMGLHP